jgi:hypothetical protein
LAKTPHTHTNACYTTRNICGTPAHRHYGGCKWDGQTGVRPSGAHPRPRVPADASDLRKVTGMADSQKCPNGHACDNNGECRVSWCPYSKQQNR